MHRFVKKKVDTYIQLKVNYVSDIIYFLDVHMLLMHSETILLSFVLTILRLQRRRFEKVNNGRKY